MEKNKKNEELQSRREFFKKAAKGALPILAFTMLGSTILTACGDDDEPKPSGCGNSCSGGCAGGCSNDCDEICMTSCANGGW